MITESGKIRIKWISAHTPYIEIVRNNARLYPTKEELLDIKFAIEQFIQAYPNDFSEKNILSIDGPIEEEFLDYNELSKRIKNCSHS